MRTYPSSSIDLYILHVKPQVVCYWGICADRMHFNSVSMHHMLDMFHVCYEVTSVNTVELRNMMCDSNQQNTENLVDHGLGVEQSVVAAVEQSGIEKLERNKGKNSDIIAPLALQGQPAKAKVAKP